MSALVSFLRNLDDIASWISFRRENQKTSKILELLLLVLVIDKKR